LQDAILAVRLGNWKAGELKEKTLEPLTPGILGPSSHREEPLLFIQPFFQIFFQFGK
jgi:hypothetical protein